MLDAELVISEIAGRWVSSKKARNHFIAEGVDFEQFPFEDAIELISLFERDLKENGEHHAFDLFKPRALHFRSPELQIETPSTLIAEQAKIVEKFQLEKTAHLILSNPERGREFINEFQQRKGSQIKTYSLAELIKSSTTYFDTKIAENKGLVEINHWPILSEIIDGFEPGRFAVFSAMSGVGKTGVTLQWALDAAENKYVLFVNQEMTPHDIGARVIGESTQLTKKQLRDGQWNADAFELLADRASKSSSLSFTDGRSLSLEQIVSLARHKKVNGGLDLLIIDYDQKIKLQLKRGQMEWQAMLDAAEILEELAKELNTYVLLLAQSGDDGQQKASKRAIQPASVHMNFIVTENEEHIIEFKKNRFGKTGIKLQVDYQPAINKVTEVGIWTPPEDPKKRGLDVRKPSRSLYHD